MVVGLGNLKIGIISRPVDFMIELYRNKVGELICLRLFGSIIFS